MRGGSVDSCYGCGIGDDDEELYECVGCSQTCCDTCLGEHCACDNPYPDVYEQGREQDA